MFSVCVPVPDAVNSRRSPYTINTGARYAFTGVVWFRSRSVSWVTTKLLVDEWMAFAYWRIVLHATTVSMPDVGRRPVQGGRCYVFDSRPLARPPHEHAHDFILGGTGCPGRCEVSQRAIDPEAGRRVRRQPHRLASTFECQGFEIHAPPFQRRDASPSISLTDRAGPRVRCATPAGARGHGCLRPRYPAVRPASARSPVGPGPCPRTP